MKPALVLTTALACWLAQWSAQAKITPERAAQLPPAAARPVDFTKDIKPLLENSCLKCHGRGQSKGGFRIDTRETFLQSADSGPAVVVGKSADSYLIELVMGFDPDSVMPKKGSHLKPDQIGLLRAWIDQGLSWDTSVSFGKLPHKNLTPRKPALPVAAKNSGLANPIDLWLQDYFTTNNVKPAAVVDDRAYARRVYLDTIGVLPTPGEVEKFAGDRAPDKRSRLVQRLLADNRRYAENWLTFWNDLLRNDYRGTGYIDGGRKQITGWLYSALATNMPYDRFVAALINPTADCEGFTKGIVWRGTVNASQVPPMQAAQSIGQVFMGVNLKCASCHDSFINDWTLADAYGLANIYSDESMQLFQCDKPTGKKADTRFIYPELGTVSAKAAKGERTAQLAGVITSEKNGRLSRTIVNRLWARFMGYGLVEPVDEMDQPAWHQDLLDWLAEDLRGNGYDLKKTIALILTSQAYQLPGVSLGEQARKDFVFRGPGVRRMSAEQFRDAITALTGVGYGKPDAQADWSAGLSAAERTGPALPLKARWIWNTPKAAQSAKAEVVYFRKTINLSTQPAEAAVALTADNSYTLYVNGKKVGSGKDYNAPNFFDLKPHLKAGANVIAIEAANNLPDNSAPTPEKAVAGTENPAGLLLYAKVRAKGKTLDFVSDASWTFSPEKQSGWEQPGFVGKNWAKASDLGEVNMAPWQVQTKFAGALSGAASTGLVRASLVAADPLMVALGRPNREQVVTERASNATTLQALELTNGSTLDSVLKAGAGKVIAEAREAKRDLATEIYLKALGRKPTAAEQKIARELLGPEARPEAVQDLLWATAMLPEFQLIY